MMRICGLPSVICLLLLHLVHDFPIPRHPVFFTSNFLDSFLVPIERFEIGLQALGLFVGCPDFLDQDLALMFKPNAGYNSAIVEENVGNKEGSDDDEQGTALLRKSPSIASKVLLIWPFCKRAHDLNHSDFG
jgi:hypothetical protein